LAAEIFEISVAMVVVSSAGTGNEKDSTNSVDEIVEETVEVKLVSICEIVVVDVAIEFGNTSVTEVSAVKVAGDVVVDVEFEVVVVAVVELKFVDDGVLVVDDIESAGVVEDCMLVIIVVDNGMIVVDVVDNGMLVVVVFDGCMRVVVVVDVGHVVVNDIGFIIAVDEFVTVPVNAKSEPVSGIAAIPRGLAAGNWPPFVLLMTCPGELSSLHLMRTNLYEKTSK
jgi:hypothetical protein